MQVLEFIKYLNGCMRGEGGRGVKNPQKRAPHSFYDSKVFQPCLLAHWNKHIFLYAVNTLITIYYGCLINGMTFVMLNSPYNFLYPWLFSLIARLAFPDS